MNNIHLLIFLSFVRFLSHSHSQFTLFSISLNILFSSWRSLFLPLILYNVILLSQQQQNDQMFQVVFCISGDRFLSIIKLFLLFLLSFHFSSNRIVTSTLNTFSIFKTIRFIFVWDFYLYTSLSHSI